MLFSLPLEVLILIFNYLVYYIRIRSSVRLRFVYRSFDNYILAAIYILPTFKDLDNNSLKHLI